MKLGSLDEKADLWLFFRLAKLKFCIMQLICTQFDVLDTRYHRWETEVRLNKVMAYFFWIQLFNFNSRSMSEFIHMKTIKQKALSIFSFFFFGTRI